MNTNYLPHKVTDASSHALVPKSELTPRLVTQLGIFITILTVFMPGEIFAQRTGSLELVCPRDLTVWACGTDSAEVYYDRPTYRTDCSSRVQVRCDPPSGSRFPLGSTTVRCEAVDDCGNRAVCSFRVIVRADREAPWIEYPSNMVVFATSSKGATVDFNVLAKDNSGRSVRVVCDPPSGSVFPLGVTPVDCEAVDECGFVSVCSFEVEVRRPKLTIKQHREGLMLTWPMSGGLEVANSVNGPWTPLPDAKSPILISPNTKKGQAYYRPLDFTAKDWEPTHRVEGRIRFEYVHYSPDILGSIGNPEWPQYVQTIESTSSRAIRSAIVVLEDDQGNYRKSKLSEEGEYSFAWNPAIGNNAKITVRSISQRYTRNAAIAKWSGPTVNSLDDLSSDTGDYTLFSYSQTFSLDSAKISNGGLKLDITIPKSHESARAFWYLENALIALDYYLDIPLVNKMPKLNIAFTPGLNLADDEGTAWYLPNKQPGFIYIPDLFGWSAFTTRHEAAHAFQAHYLRSTTYGKLGEPLANAHAVAMVGGSRMDLGTQMEDLDTQANFKNDAFRQEDQDGNYWQYTDGTSELNYSYGWTQRVLWDLLDGTQAQSPELLTSFFPHNSNQLFDAGEFDLINGGASFSTSGDQHLLNDVLINYLGGGIWGTQSPNYQDRGLIGADLVDVLDGFICRGHATTAQIDQLINYAMKFGYPLDAPANCD